jgi:hypothetical protein
MYIGLHVKCPSFLSDFNQLEFSQKIFEIYSNMKFHENPNSGVRIVTCGRTDRRTEKRTDGQTYMTKLIVTFRNFANAPKNGKCIPLWNKTGFKMGTLNLQNRIVLSPCLLQTNAVLSAEILNTAK